ncbi:MAG: hypothetical protein HY829_10205 [Actinobacteria bacterium]|nr:hypothetical protein [Actinomycetota bacterium]
MSFYLGYDSWTASRDSERLPAATLRDIVPDEDLGLAVIDEPVRTRLASFLRRTAGLQIALAARLDDNVAQPLAA